MEFLSSRKGFNLISPFYDRCKRLVFGHWLDDAQTALWNEYPPHGKQLLIGGGTGDLLLQLSRQKKVMHIVCVDISDAMLDQSKRRLQKENPEAMRNVSFVQKPIQSFETNEIFEGIHAPFILDCLSSSDLRLTLLAFRSYIKKEGCLYVTDFSPSSTQRWKNRIILRLLYLGFHTFIKSGRNNIPDWERILTDSGWRLLSSKLLNKRLISAHTWRTKP